MSRFGKRPRNPDCSVPSCPRESKSKGRCLAHANVNAAEVPRPLPPLPVCKKEGCPHDAIVRGFCAGCAARSRRRRPVVLGQQEDWEDVVYPVQCLTPCDGFRGPLKIGHSKLDYLKHRLRGLQTGCPYPLRLVGVVPGGLPMEQELHHQFAESRMKGEWFALTPDLEDFVKAIQAFLKDRGV